MPPAETLVAIQNVGLGIASFAFLAVIIWYIIRRDDKRYDAQVERDDKRYADQIAREDKRVERDDKRLEAWQGITQTQSTQIATLIHQIGSLSTQSANQTATMIEILQITGRIEEFEKHSTVRLEQLSAMIGDKRRPDTGDLSRMIGEGKR